MKIYRLLFLASLIGCASVTKTTEIKTTERNKKVQALVESKVFEIKNEIATPIAVGGFSDFSGPRNNTTNLSLERSNSHFRIKNDSISVYLPFHGRRNIFNYGQSATNHESFIVYYGKPQNIKSSYNEKKNEYRYDMRFKSNRESFRVRLIIQGDDGRSNIFLSSTDRSSIYYSGKIESLALLE
jgi:hypothetical protein